MRDAGSMLRGDQESASYGAPGARDSLLDYAGSKGIGAGRPLGLPDSMYSALGPPLLLRTWTMRFEKFKVKLDI